MQLGLSIKELAELSDLFPSTISRIEKEKGDVSRTDLTSILKLSKGLNTTMEYLYQTSDWTENTIPEIMEKYQTLNGVRVCDLVKLTGIHKDTILGYRNGSVKDPGKKYWDKICEAIGYDNKKVKEKIRGLPEDTLGQRVYKKRMELGLTITEVAELSGLRDSTISGIEKEKGDINKKSISSLFRISKALNTTMEYLYQTQDWPENTAADIIKKYQVLSGIRTCELVKLTGIPLSTLSGYKSSKKSPSKDNWNKICTALGYEKNSNLK
ncbi:helix-turn-helix domain-containing protein [Anaeromicrobium sediminis]|uniref:HTH cro/C1-type domain-containing protein n=1 Tax=Anaeromicrobium sediminis TaxID=1478221 RepID=A0A267MNX9_9FIRM|nr:helix-turn-helix transcriptional regulator [Anaeromicrobium sediminis]PAB61301.1 hypothetical protein CCE28_02395 [Anaeromicrobium sediminis]